MRSTTFMPAAFLIAMTFSGCGNAPGFARPEAEVLRPDDQLNFRALYNENCAGCHGADGRNGAAIELANPEYQALVDDQSLRNWVSRGMPGTEMPAFARSAGGPLTDQQIQVIVRGMREDWARSIIWGAAKPPSYEQQVKGYPPRGKQNYHDYCASCHQDSNQQISSPDYLALVNDQALRSIIVAGRPDISQPDWKNDKAGGPLSDQEVTDIVAYLASLRSPDPGQPASATSVRYPK